MSTEAVRLNQLYLNELEEAGEGTALWRVRNLWWKAFEKGFKEDPAGTIDALDLSMDGGRSSLHEMAHAYSKSRDHKENTPKYTQLVSQFLKSNTGKMFERFVGLALAYALKQSNSPYCIMPFKSATWPYCHKANRDSFAVTVRLGDRSLLTAIDADLLAFNPEDEDADIFMISIKSTLKDRFHNVPFWNLLRTVAVTGAMGNVRASKRDFLRKLRYIVICSDLAAEQPDFSGKDGPRNLIALDAALLDGAYVSASRAVGLGTDKIHLGPNRRSAFYPLSSFYNTLAP